MKQKLLILSLILLSGSEKLFAQYSWNPKANFNGGVREGASGFSVGTKGYFFGGNDPSTVYNDLWEFDPTTNSWSQKSSLPGSVRKNAIAFSIGPKAYVGSGYASGSSYLTDFWEYDPVANNWTQKANIPGPPTYGAVGFAINSKGYFGTGNTGSAAGPYRDDFYEYDPALNAWTPKANFPGGTRYGAFGLGISNKGYLGFGLYDGSGGQIIYGDWWEFDPVNNTWTSRTSYPASGRTYLGGFVINNKPFVGTGASTMFYNDFYSFDPTVNSWAPIANFPGAARYLTAYFSIGNIGYVGGGYNFSGDYNDFYEYAPAGVAPIVNIQSSETSWCNKKCIDFFDLSANNPTTWQWYFPGAAIDTSTLQNPVGICYNNSGSFDVTLIACNNNGCDSVTFSNFINEYPMPVSIYTFQTNSCDTSKTASFSNQSLYGTSYIWHFGDGTSDTIANPTHQYAASGTYPVSLIVINNCGSDTVLQTVNIVSHNNAQAAFSFSSQPCSLQVSFNDSSLNATGLIWNFGDGSIDSINNNPSHTYNIAGIYNVTLIAKDSCRNDTTQVTVNLTSAAQPVSNFTFQTVPCDTDLIVTFSNQSLNSLNYNWNFGDGSSDTISNPMHQYSSAGAYTVTLICYNLCGSDTIFINVQVDSAKNKVALFDYSVVECTGDVVLQNQSLNGTDYFWDFGDGNTSTTYNPIHTYSTSGSFVVKLIVDPNSPCPDSISQTIKIENINNDTLFIPNCFTPNADGLNDSFEITGYNDCNTYQLKIFNRWGQLVFKTDDLKNKWNGKFENSDVQEGAYFYIVKLTSSYKTGSITVLR